MDDGLTGCCLIVVNTTAFAAEEEHKELLQIAELVTWEADTDFLILNGCGLHLADGGQIQKIPRGMD